MNRTPADRWLIIHPPVVRNCEPPPGPGRIAGVLSSSGINYEILDLNAEGFDWLISRAQEGGNSGMNAAVKNREQIINRFRNPEGYTSVPRYRKGVSDLGLLLKSATLNRKENVTPTDYQDPALSPLSVRDLITSASEEDKSLFHPLYSSRLRKLEPFTHAAVSIGFLSQALCGFAVIGHLRKHYSQVKIHLGGSLITSWVLNNLLDATEDFDGLIDRIIAGRFEDHPDLLFPMESRILSVPDYTRFPLHRYLSPGPIIPLNLSWGCPWKRCSFCPEKSENSPYKPLALSDVVTQAGEMAEKYNPVLLHFTDSEISVAALKALAEHPPGVPWYGFARFSRELSSPEFCRKLAESGCVMLQLGQESGSQRVLDSLNKGTALGENSRIIKNLYEAGIGVFLYVLFGTPAETEEEAVKTRDFIELYSPYLSGLNTAIFNMPRTGSEASLYASGEFYQGDLSLYCSFEHPEGWNRDKVRRFIKTEYETSPGIRKVINNTPPVYTSSHAMFFRMFRHN